MRSISKEQAASATIKAALFRTIELTATQKEMRALKSTDLTFLAPFIRKVTFLPSPDHLCLGQRDIRELFPGSTGADKIIKSFTHQERARQDKSLFNGNTLYGVWTALLRQLQIAHSYHVHSLLANHPFLSDLAPEATDTSGINNAAVRIEQTRDILHLSSYPGYVDFMRTVLQCLASVQSKVKALEIDCELLYCPNGWYSRTEWRSLYLDNLRSLKFITPLFRQGHGEEAPDGYPRDWTISAAMDTIFANMACYPQNLELIRYVGLPSTMLQLSQPHRLRLLQTFRLEDIEIDPAPLKAAMLIMTHLREVHFKNCLAEPWKPVFEALHQNAKLKPLYITFHDCVGYEEGSIEYPDFILHVPTTDEALDLECELLADTTDARLNGRRYNLDKNSPTPSEMKELLYYLTGRGAWTPKLELVFAR